MWSWNQFRNLPKNQALSAQEQARQYFIHQSNMMYEASLNTNVATAVAAAAASSAAGGAGGGGGLRRPSGWIDLALESLNSRYEEITDLVPNLYCFWDDYPTVNDDGDIPILTGINSGGDDMYDGGNFMNTNLTANWDDIKEGASDDSGTLSQASIPYTHTQASSDNGDNEYFNPPMNGQVKSGDSYFGVGSRYFTNMYPGLFIMIADDISISEFNISGNVGSDGEGTGAGYVDFIIPGWTLFYKTNTDNGDGPDPSINQLILVPGTSYGITQEYDTISEDDDHRISGIDDRSRIIYAVVARQPDEGVLSEADAVKVAQKILEIFTTPSLTDLLVFGIKSITTTVPDDYMLFNLKDNGTVSAFEISNDIFYGPTVFADNPDDGFKYFVTQTSGSALLFGKMSDSGVVTLLNEDLLPNLGGGIDNLIGSVSFTEVAGIDDTYIGITGSTTLGIGYDAKFDIFVTGGTVSSVLVNSLGDLYKVNDTISISADKIGGSASQNLIITVNSIKSDASPTSLYYEGEGQFIYMDRLLILDTIESENLSPKIARINTNGDIELVTLDNTVSEYSLYPTSLFSYQGDTWGVFSDVNLPLAFVSKYNINTGLKFSDDMQVNINNVPNISMSKTWLVISAINIDDKIYCNFICNDKLSNNTFQCIGELNVETGDAEFLYFVPLSISGDDSSYLYTNITKYKK